MSRLKEYKILTADSLEQAEQVMNDMAQVGWRVVGTTAWSPWAGISSSSPWSGMRGNSAAAPAKDGAPCGAGAPDA